MLPSFASKRHLPSKLRRLRELDGGSAVQIRGAGTEFDSLRDYVRGDDVRSIDWRATARRRDTVVRTWRPERDRRVVVVLDTSRTSAARVLDEPRLDTGIEAALLLSVLAERGGDKVHFLAFDRRLRARVDSTAKGNLLGSLVTAMAPLEAELIEADWSRVPAQVRAVSPHRSLVVLLTSLDAGAVEEGLLAGAAGPDRAPRRRGRLRPRSAPRGDGGRPLDRGGDLPGRGGGTCPAGPGGGGRPAPPRRRGGRGRGARGTPPLLADTYIRLKATGRL